MMFPLFGDWKRHFNMIFQERNPFHSNRFAITTIGAIEMKKMKMPQTKSLPTRTMKKASPMKPVAMENAKPMQGMKKPKAIRTRKI